MAESESDYPVPVGKHLSYEDSWRPEDKAMEAAEIEVISEHPDLLKKSGDTSKRESASKDQSG